MALRSKFAAAWASPVSWVIVNGLLIAALVVGVGYARSYGERWFQHRDQETARAAAVAAAQRTVINFISISADSVDKDLQNILAGATGDFKDEFSRTMQQVRTTVLENKVSSVGALKRVGVTECDRDSAIVLLAVDATVKNVRAPQGRLSHYRFQVDMAYEGGKWLVARLQFVG